MTTQLFAERKVAIFQLKRGKGVEEVAQSLNRSPNWVRKWQKRFQEKGWKGLREESRAPLHPGNKVSEEVRQAIWQARLELEAGAALGEGLKYIGGAAVRTKLKQQKVTALPSIPTIERILRESRLTHPKATATQPSITYPHLQPTQPHQLCQVDIVPHFLQGGQRIACFNAIDVVSRYPTGQPFPQRRSQDAVEFLIQVWQEIGIPHYTQVDNEGCFSGGATHPYVLGSVVRLALEVGTQLVFSPVYHPQSNGSVERFHQDYNLHVWQDTYLQDLAQVEQQGQHFFQLYRDRLDHSQLQEQSPHTWHHRCPPHPLSANFATSPAKQPLRQGLVHFMRQVSSAGTVRVLNVDWSLPTFQPTKGVWVTIQFQVKGATLSIFDAAPDVPNRRCLAAYPFPLKEPVLPRTEMTTELAPSTPLPQPLLPLSSLLWPTLSTNASSAIPGVIQAGEWLLLSTLDYTARLTRRFFHTMF